MYPPSAGYQVDHEPDHIIRTTDTHSHTFNEGNEIVFGIGKVVQDEKEIRGERGKNDCKGIVSRSREVKTKTQLIRAHPNAVA